MIDAILNALITLAESVISILPDYVPSNTGAFSGMIEVISTINKYFPVDTLASCVTGYLSFAIMLSGVRMVLKFVHLA